MGAVTEVWKRVSWRKFKNNRAEAKCHTVVCQCYNACLIEIL